MEFGFCEYEAVRTYYEVERSCFTSRCAFPALPLPPRQHLLQSLAGVHPAGLRRGGCFLSARRRPGNVPFLLGALAIVGNGKRLQGQCLRVEQGRAGEQGSDGLVEQPVVLLLRWI